MGNLGIKPSKFTKLTDKIAGLSHREVDNLIEEFTKAQHSDKVNLNIFAKVLAIHKITQTESEQLFKIFDDDNSGSLTVKEIMTGVTLLSHSTLEAKTNTIFNLFDTEKNQLLTFEEITDLALSVIDIMCKLSSQNPPSKNDVQSFLKFAFSECDTNKNGHFDLYEFSSLVTKDKQILYLLLSQHIITREDLRKDFGTGADGLPECDSDLEEETSHEEHHSMDTATEMIKLGLHREGETITPHVGSHAHSFLAVRPWLGAVEATVPTSYKKSPLDSEIPDAHLELEYIYGYRCHDTRNNLFYNSKGEVVYHTAAVGITLNKTETRQKFHVFHTDDITAMDMAGDTVVTGQIGRTPLVCVWNAVTMENIVTFQGGLEHSILLTAISPDGKKIAAIANDPDHTLGFFDVEKFLQDNGNITKAKCDGTITTIKTSKTDPLCLKFHPTESKLIIAGNKEIIFVNFGNKGLKMTKGIGWGSDIQAISSIGFLGDKIVTGSFKGQLLIWENEKLVKKIDAHQGNINAIWTRKNNSGLISGGADGNVIVWDSSFEKKRVINLKELNLSLKLKVRSVCENLNGSILVGTRGGEIIEFSIEGKANVLMRGHFDDELWALCTSPTKDTFFTVGQDNLLTSWDAKTHKQISATKVDFIGSAIAISPDGKSLAIGYSNGCVQILDSSSFAVVSTLKDRSKEISEIKYSPNGEYLAVGSHDSEIINYQVNKNYHKLSVCRGHHSAISHIDFSTDSSHFQSTCTSYELLFWNIKDGTKLNAPKFKDEHWATWTNKLGWPVQGIWPENSKGTDIHSVDRHPNGKILATADDFSHVKLFKYPCPVERSSSIQYIGHSSHVTKVRFTSSGEYLISTGGFDKSIFQWKFTYNHEAEIHSKNRKVEVDTHEEVRLQSKVELKKTVIPSVLHAVSHEETKHDTKSTVDAHDAFNTHSKSPFAGQLLHSTPDKYLNPDKSLGAAINGNLTLKYCHGYQCHSTKGVVKYSANNNHVVIAGAALGIVLDKTTKEQSFFQHHDDDVVSIAIHPNGKIAASGQVAHKGESTKIDIFVWEIESKNMLARLNDFHLRAVRHLAFSTSGKYLLSFGADDSFSLAIYDWAQGILISTSKVDRVKVTDCGFKSDTEFFSCGLGHVKVWTTQGRNLNAKKCILPENLHTESFLCGTWAFNNELLVVGTLSGKLIPFIDGKAVKEISDVHEKGVTMIVSKGEHIYTGGHDGKISYFNLVNGNIHKLGDILDISKITQNPSKVLSLDISPDEKNILVGTNGGEIFELSSGKANLLLQGHSSGELWGLATHPSGSLYATCGGDKTVRIWNSDSYKQVACSKIYEHEMRALDWSRDGKLLVLADISGIIYLFDDSLKELSKFKSSFDKKDQWIQDIKFSPDSTLVAFGAHGGASPIEIVRVKERKLEKEKILHVGISSALIHLDWSQDSSILIVNSEAYELLFISLKTGKQVEAKQVKDEEWSSWTCKIGWPVRGIFKNTEYFQVNSVHRSASKKAAVTGDDDGMVNLFRYPCPVEKAQAKAYKGHSSHVTRTRFTFDDSKVVSVGGNDKCILVWQTDFGGDNHEDLHEHHDFEDHEVHEVIKPKVIKEMHHAKSFSFAPTSTTTQSSTSSTSSTSFSTHTETKVDSKAISSTTAQQNVPRTIQHHHTVSLNNPVSHTGPGGSGAIKPWHGQMMEPEDVKLNPNLKKAPKAELQLEHVHGYRAKDCRNNIKILADGSVVYHAAALGIVYDINTNNQRFFNLHTDDIVSLDVHPKGQLVATGELGANPLIYIWDSSSLQPIVKIKSGMEKGIASVSFSPSGKYLVASALDDKHHVSIYDTQLGTILAQDQGDTAPITSVKFKNDSEFISIGPKHLKFWTFSNKTLTNKRGIFGSSSNMLRCVEFFGEYALIGSIEGHLQVWKGNQATKDIQLHKSALDAIYVGNNILTGGFDGVVNVLDHNFKVFATISLPENIHPHGIRALIPFENDQNFIFGTFGSEIYKMTTNDKSISSSSKFDYSALVQGHYTPNQQWTNEVWGLAVFNKSERWITCSDDSTLRVWSSRDKKMILKVPLNIDLQGKILPVDEKTKDFSDVSKGRSIDVSPDDKLIAVGTLGGTIRILDSENYTLKTILHDSKAWISVLKFSPDGKLLAAGSHDTAIYIYSVADFKKLRALKKHSAQVLHLDWSQDSKYLHSVCAAHELLYWDINGHESNGHLISDGVIQLRNENWATWTCTLGWPVQGIMTHNSNIADVKSCDRGELPLSSMDSQLLVSSELGKLKLFRYPCLDGSEYLVGSGHSSHITSCKFSKEPLQDGKDGQNELKIFSSGGEDNCVFQWRVTSS